MVNKEEVQEALDKLGEIAPGVKLKVNRGYNYWSNAVDVVHLVPEVVDKTSDYDIRGYITNRFRGVSKKLADLDDKKLASAHRRFINRCVELTRDYRLLEKFVAEEIKFKYSECIIHVGSIIFRISHPEVVDTIISIKYTLHNGKLTVVNNQGTQYISAGTAFLAMQKELAKNLTKEKIENYEE